MSAYVLTPLAKADIFNIWSYIVEDNEDAASRVERVRASLLPKFPCVAIPGPTSQLVRFVSGR